MDVTSVWKAIRTRWLIVAVVTVVVASLAGLATMLRTPMYTATAEGLVSISHPQTRPPWALTNGSQYIIDRMTSYAQLGGTTPVILPVYARLQLQETLIGRVSSSWATDKALLRITVSYSDRTLAAHIADGILQQLGATIERIENGNILVTEVSPAAIPSAPSNHKVALNGVVGAGGGLALGLFVAVGLQAISDRARRRGVARSKWVIDTDTYVHLCRAGRASLFRQLAPDGQVLVPAAVNSEIESARAQYPDVPSAGSVDWAQIIVPTEEENLTQLQLKARMGGSDDQHLAECAVIACAFHRDFTAVLSDDVAMEQANRLGVPARGILWIVIEAYTVLYDKNRDLAAAIIDDLLATGVELPFDSGKSLFTWADREGLLPQTA